MLTYADVCYIDTLLHGTGTWGRSRHQLRRHLCGETSGEAYLLHIAYVSIRQHTSYSIRQRPPQKRGLDISYVVIYAVFPHSPHPHITAQAHLCGFFFLPQRWRMLTYADVSWPMLTYADVCWRMLYTYADVCWRMPYVYRFSRHAARWLHHFADVCWRMPADVCWRMSADVCWRMLTYAIYVCWRMLTYAICM